MTTGTKVFLAFFAVIVGFLVLYYGVWAPGDEPMNVIAKVPADVNSADTGQPALGRSPAEVPPSEPQTPKDASVDASSSTPSVAGTDPQNTNPAAPDQAGPVPVDATNVVPLVGMTPPAGPPDPESTPASSPPQDSIVKANEPISIAPPSSNGSAGNQTQKPTGEPPVQIGPVKSATTTKLVMPPPASPSSTRSSPPQTQDYIIKPGDTFMTIATDWFGDQTKWSMIAKANPLVDPTRLKIGQKIRLPAKDAKPEPIKAQVSPAADGSHYIVRSGDTLAKIARELYGDVAKWQAIYDANKTLIGSDPANLETGTKLTLPATLKKIN